MVGRCLRFGLICLDGGTWMIRRPRASFGIAGRGRRRGAPALEPGNDGGPDVEVPGGDGHGDVLGLPDGAEVGVVGHLGGMGEEPVDLSGDCRLSMRMISRLLRPLAV